MIKHKNAIVFLLVFTLLLSACSSKESAVNVTSEVSGTEVTEVNPEPEPEPEEPEHTYADVLPDSKFFEAIESAAAKGLLEGFTKDDNFRPDDKLTNADMALLFYNMAGRPKLDEEVADLQITNLKEVGGEQAMAIRWFYGELPR